MKEKYSIVYACPYCKAPLDMEKDLVIDGEIREGMMWCSQDQHQFPVRKGIPRLLITDAEYEPVTSEYESNGERHVIIEDPEYYKDLPYKTSKNSKEWELRKINFEKLMSLLKKENKTRILDLGSGNCWLSNRLSDYYEVFAMDVNSGPTGLEISDIYFTDDKYFERAQGEPTNLPLAEKQFDIVICSAALNRYNPSLVIGEITRVLKDDGVLFILDSQIYATPEGAKRAMENGEGEFYPLYKQDLDKELRNIYEVKYHYPDYGKWWSFTKAVQSLILQKEYPSIPIIYGRRK